MNKEKDLYIFNVALRDSLKNKDYYDVVLMTDKYLIGNMKLTKLYSIKEIVLKYLQK